VPRPDKPRTIGAERNVALRVRLERIARGWSYATFASKMSDAGYPIHGSAVYKIEHGTRRITVEELVAISYVFGLDIEDLISTPDDTRIALSAAEAALLQAQARVRELQDAR